jgi:serine/threonine-protein kinase
VTDSDGSHPAEDQADRLDDDLEAALAHGYGGGCDPDPAPSVLARIARLAGSTPGVHLREESAGDTPMLRPLAAGERLAAGKYVVHGELGRGGVGAVHRGHDQDLGRDVAMKFLHERYQRDQGLLHRFVEEAQIGGQLQHPGIVPVYDLGIIDGRPFFTMKLVKGQTLAKKLAERASPAGDLRTFLSVFEDVCQTLAYAHARGVVHRDLKPANVMIGSFGEVQVVDWGMGKVLPQGGVADERRASERRAEVSIVETVRSSSHGSRSVVGSVMGTPAYMPPEQARGDVERMDERSDVFALGAILCEILTGAPPYVGPAAKLIEQAASAELADAEARLAAADVDPELAALALRCLAPAPAARPRSAEVVAQAIHDHLASVEARAQAARIEAAEARVRARALKRTQRLGLGIVAVVGAALVVSLLSWRSARRSANEEQLAGAAARESEAAAAASERVALAAKARAEGDLRRTQEMQKLILDVLSNVDPAAARTADTTLLRGVLDRTAHRIDSGVVDEETAAQLHLLVGKVYRAIGRSRTAIEHSEAAVEGLRRAHGAENELTLKARLEQAEVLLDLGRLDEGEDLIRDNLATLERVLGPDAPLTIQQRSALAGCFYERGRYAEAEALYDELLAAAEGDTAAAYPTKLADMSNLASVYISQRRFVAAEELCRKTLASKEAELGPDHPRTLLTRSTLAFALQGQGRLAEAEASFRETLALQERILGDEHPATLTTLNLLATAYSEQGRVEEAEALSLRLLERQERALGPEHQDTLGTITNLGYNNNQMGRYDVAVGYLERSLPAKRRVLGPDHPWTRLARGNLAHSYLELGRRADALALESEQLELDVATAERPDAGLATIYAVARNLLEHPFEELQDPARALRLAQRALSIVVATDARVGVDPARLPRIRPLPPRRGRCGDREPAASRRAPARRHGPRLPRAPARVRGRRPGG